MALIIALLWAASGLMFFVVQLWLDLRSGLLTRAEIADSSVFNAIWALFGPCAWLFSFFNWLARQQAEEGFRWMCGMHEVEDTPQNRSLYRRGILHTAS